MNTTNPPTPSSKIRVATVSLAGCFGCHMSLLDIDEKLLTLLQKIEFTCTPLMDIKHCPPSTIGLIEGGVCTEENVRVLRAFRDACQILVAIGACAMNGGIPAYRNAFSVRECLTTAYLDPDLRQPQFPADPQLPLLLNKVYPLHEVVKIDYFLPGCPPSADAIWTFFNELLQGQPIQIPYQQLHYD